MDSKIAFEVIKNVIIEQNKELLQLIANKYNLDYDELVEKYITPAHYLPVIQNTETKGCNPNSKEQK